MFSVIVPTFNECDNARELVARVLAAFRALPEPAELLVVDDDSPDGTAAAVRDVAAELGAGDQVRVLVRTADKGLAKAVMAGFDAARGDVLAVMDADLSHPPELLGELAAALRGGGKDLAVASRYVPGGGTEGWPWHRRVVSRVAGWLARPLTSVRDTTSGFFALRRACLDAVRTAPRGYKISLEFLARTPPARVVEVPFIFRDRTRGSSKLGGAVIVAYLIQLAGLYRIRFPTLVGYFQFAVVGLGGMLVDALVFGIAYWYLGLSRLGPFVGGFFAQSGSFVVAAGFNYIFNAAWTFRERAGSGRPGIYLLVALLGFGLRSLVFEAIVDIPFAGGLGGLPVEQFALFAGIAVGSIWNFYGSRRWAFPLPAGTAPGLLPAPQELRARAWVFGLLLVLVSVRLFFAATTALAGDEAYYWQWSRHLAWGYYDHPPMVAYVIAAGTRLLGVNVLGVRIVPLFMSWAAVWMIYRLALALWGSAHAGLWAVAGALTMPLFSVGGLFATPDTPLIFFWAATLLAVLRALRTDRYRDWLLAGLLAGFGLLSKYPMVLLLAAILLALLVLPRGRAALRRPGPYAGLAVAALVCTPLLLWNLSRGMGSVVYQLHHGLSGANHHAHGLKTFLTFIGGQVGVVTPVLFALAAWALWRAGAAWVRRSPTAGGTELEANEVLPFLLFPAIVTLGVFTVASFLAKSESNWAAPAYVTVLAILGGELARWTSADRWRKGAVIVGVGFAGLLSLYMHVEAAFPLLPYKKGPFVRVHDHAGLTRWAASLVDHDAAAHARVLASSYQLASLLAFYLPGHPATDSPFERGSGSSYLQWRQPVRAGETGWFFTAHTDPREPQRLYTTYHLVGHYVETRLGVKLRTIDAYFGTLRPGPLAGVRTPGVNRTAKN